MSKVQKRTFSLTEQQSAYIDSVVSSGGYASSSEVIREGIRILQEKDARLEKWLRDEVGPTFDAWQVSPDDVMAEDRVFAELDAEFDGDVVKKAS